MPNVPFLQIDAFTAKPFAGNPAAVVPLENWPEDEILLNIAREMNLSETAYIVPRDEKAARYHLRWFTPAKEVDLCGHATLAAGAWLLESLYEDADEILFESQSGELRVARHKRGYALDFPLRLPEEAAPPPGLYDAMGAEAEACLTGGRDWLLVYPDREAVAALSPDFRALRKVDADGVIATAKGRDVDFVSRCFYPKYDIDEDPVTGSAHCVSGPYWADRLDKTSLRARQISRRGGDLWLDIKGDRISIAGRAVRTLEGTLLV